MDEPRYPTDFDPWCSICDGRTPHRSKHDSPPLCADCKHPEHLPKICDICVYSEGYGPDAINPPEYCDCGPHEEETPNAI